MYNYIDRTLALCLLYFVILLQMYMNLLFLLDKSFFITTERNHAVCRYPHHVPSQ